MKKLLIQIPIPIVENLVAMAILVSRSVKGTIVKNSQWNRSYWDEQKYYENKNFIIENWILLANNKTECCQISNVLCNLASIALSLKAGFFMLEKKPINVEWVKYFKLDEEFPYFWKEKSFNFLNSKCY